MSLTYANNLGTLLKLFTMPQELTCSRAFSIGDGIINHFFQGGRGSSNHFIFWFVFYFLKVLFDREASRLEAAIARQPPEITSRSFSHKVSRSLKAIPTIFKHYEV